MHDCAGSAARARSGRERGEGKAQVTFRDKVPKGRGVLSAACCGRAARVSALLTEGLTRREPAFRCDDMAMD